jgi:vitamin-K-epoxide reductase (warfarin-sensitive)
MRYLIALLALAGVVVSGLALHVHTMDPGATPPCAVSEHWDCGVVNHGRYSVFPPRSFDETPDSKAKHVPVAVIGIAGYLMMAAAALFGRLRIVLWLSQVGFLCAVVLSFLEAYVIEKWCIYCLWSQVIVATILAITAVTLYLQGRRRVRTAGFAA